jgi:hypothetical protein
MKTDDVDEEVFTAGLVALSAEQFRIHKIVSSLQRDTTALDKDGNFGRVTRSVS